MIMEGSPQNKRIMSDMKPVARKAALPVAKKTKTVPKHIEEPEPAVTPVVTATRHFLPLQPSSRGAAAERRAGTSAPRRGGCVIPFLILVCALALTLAIGGLWNHAKVTIVRQSFSGAVDTTVNLSQVRVSGTVRLATATRTFTADQVVPKSGTQGVNASASGTVRFYNSGSSVEKVSIGTVLVSSKSLNYMTQKAVSVPAEKKGVPGHADVTITSETDGSQFNSAPDDFTFSGVSFPQVSVHSLTPIAGGSSSADSVADPSLIASASASVVGMLPDASVLAGRMARELPNTVIVLPVSFPSSAPTVSVDPHYPDGVHVIASETISILLADRAGFARALGDTLSVPQSTQLTLDDFAGLTVTTNALASSSVPPTALQVRVTGNAQLYGLVGSDGLAEKLTGQSKSAVSGVLSKIAEIKSFSIRLTPFWRRTLPSNPLDISVEVR